MKISHPKSIFSTRTNETKTKTKTKTKNQRDSTSSSSSSSSAPTRRPLLSASARPKSQLDKSSTLASNPHSTTTKNKTFPRLTPTPAVAVAVHTNAHTHANANAEAQAQARARESLNDGLAICLFGYSVQAQSHPIRTPEKDTTTATAPAQTQGIGKSLQPPPNAQNFTFDMFDASYEEEIRQQAVMAEVLPDAEMWAKWEKTEAPLRQGRGWYPRLDRHFLELLVTSEIHALSHPLRSTPAGTADRIHRHATRVRRVACERIGAERLNAYCERVKEAFEAYMMGGWAHTQGIAQTQTQRATAAEPEASKGEDRSEDTEDGDEEDSVDGLTSLENEIQMIEERDRNRGRTLKREGNTVQAEKSSSVSPPHPATIHFATSSLKSTKPNVASSSSSGSDLGSASSSTSAATEEGHTQIPSQDNTSPANSSRPAEPEHNEARRKTDPFGDEINTLMNDDALSGESEHELSQMELNDIPLDDEREISEEGSASASASATQSRYHLGTPSVSTSARATRGSAMDVDLQDSGGGSDSDSDPQEGQRRSGHDMDIDLNEDITYSTVIRTGRQGRPSVDRMKSA